MDGFARSPEGEVDAPIGGNVSEVAGVKEDAAAIGEVGKEVFAQMAVLGAGEVDGVAEEGEVTVGEMEGAFDLADSEEELGKELLSGSAEACFFHFKVRGGLGTAGLVGAVFEVVGSGVRGIDEEEEGFVGLKVVEERGGEGGEEIVDGVVEEVEAELGGLGVVGLAEVEFGGFVGGGVESGETEVASQVAGAPGAIPDHEALAPILAQFLGDEAVGEVDEGGGCRTRRCGGA